MFPLGYLFFDLDFHGTSLELIGISVSLAVLMLLMISMNNKFLYLKSAVFVYSALLVAGIAISATKLSKDLEATLQKDASLMSEQYHAYLKSLFDPNNLMANFEVLMFQSKYFIQF